MSETEQIATAWARLTAANEELRAMLREFEWIAPMPDVENNVVRICCGKCGGPMPDHAPDCPLAKLLEVTA